MKDFDHEDLNETVRRATEDISETVREAVHGALEDTHAALRDAHLAVGELHIGGFDDEPIGGEQVTDDLMDRTFEVRGQATISVNTVSGRVSVRRGADGQIRVHASKHGSGHARQNTTVELRHEGDSLAAITRTLPSSGWFGVGRTMASVDFDIEVPAGCRVNIKTVSADVHVSQTHGPATIQTVSGDASLEDVAGECNVTTVSGDVVGRQIAGDMTLRTTSGDGSFTDSSLRAFNINTVSGDFTVETPLTNGSHYFAKTMSGDLRLVIPGNTGATVQMKSMSGDVVSDLPADIIKAGRRSWQGRINGGGAYVEMHSMSGDLRISRSSSSGRVEAPPVAPTVNTTAAAEPASPSAPPPPPLAPEAHADFQAPETAAPAAEAPAEPASPVEVLAALQRGEITVEEAMARLDEAGSR